jgi:hypothetical protein
MSNELDEKPSRLSLDNEKGASPAEDLSANYEGLPADPDAHLSPEEKAALVMSHLTY